MTRGTLSVIVFAVNEAPNVRPVLGELRHWLSTNEADSEIVFVDDGSTDSTTDAAAEALQGTRFQLYRHDTNRGIGAALKTGVQGASGEWITFLPADGQIPPAAIGMLREAAGQHDADVVLSVYARRNDGLQRKILSWGVRTLIAAVHGVRLQSEGPYLFRKLLFDPGQLHSDSFFLNFEFPIRALRAGLRVTTVSIPCRQRRAGLSKSKSVQKILFVARELLEMRLRRTRDAWGRATGRSA